MISVGWNLANDDQDEIVSSARRLGEDERGWKLGNFCQASL